MNDQINSINLTVEEMSANGNRMKIKSSGKSYSFFKTKQDGNPSKAWADYQNLGVTIGGTYNCGVTEKPGDYQGKPITYRNIISFKPATAQNAAPLMNPNGTFAPQPPNLAEEIKKTQEFIKKLVRLNNLKVKEEEPIKVDIPQAGWSSDALANLSR